MDNDLESVGFSRNETKIYYALIKQGRAPVNLIYKLTGIHRRNIYDSMQRLTEKGVVFAVRSNKENMYQAVNPLKLSEILQEKTNKLNSILPHLQKNYQQQAINEEVYIYKGIEGFKNNLKDILRIKEDVFFIGAKGFWFDPRMIDFTMSFLKELKKKKIKIHHLFDFEVKEKGKDILKVLPTPHKFLPAEMSSKLATCIYGDRVVSYTGKGVSDLGESITLFITVSREVADGQRKIFKYLWETL